MIIFSDTSDSEVSEVLEFNIPRLKMVFIARSSRSASHTDIGTRFRARKEN